MRTLRLVAASAVVLLVGVLVPPAPAATGEQPVPKRAGSSDWRQVSAGGRHSCGIRTSGRLFCWGADDRGQLGDGGTNTPQPMPVEVAGGETDWVAVSAGYDHTCALRSSGRLYCWGIDDNGELGDGSPGEARTVPTQVAGGATSWAAVSSGWHHTCALRRSGRLYCWGLDSRGQLGRGTIGGSRFSPAQVVGQRTDWSLVSSGTAHTCALRSTGRAFCWGNDELLQLGDGDSGSTTGTPSQVAGGRTDWTSISSGAGHTCALRASGRLYCWGQDGLGQLGDGAAGPARGTPGQVAGASTQWRRVVSGQVHTCAMRANRRVFCWGDDTIGGQLGDGEPLVSADTPQQLAGGATDWTALSSLGDHTCATTTAKRLYCWGYNDFGQLGATTSAPWSPEPIEVHS